MRWLRSIVREIAGLFVDDRGFAAALLVWMVGGTVMLRFFHADHWGGPLLALGLAAVLVESVLRSSLRGRRPSAGESDDRATRRPD